MRKATPTAVCRTVAFAACALLLSFGNAFAQTAATVTRPANLRADHDASAALVKHLDVSTPLTVLDPTPQNGYLHVRTAEGDEGWAFAKNLTVNPTVTRKPAHQPTAFSARAAKAHARSSGPCAASLDQCAKDGCDAPGTPHALLNNRKRTVPPDGPVVTLTYANLRALQSSTDGKGIAQGADISDRGVLSGLDIGGGHTISEGTLVQVAGFISPERTLSKGSAESVNCRLTATSATDVHLPIAEIAEGTEYESFVAEPIPQDRPSTWNLTLWKKIQTDGTKILVRGQLLYDNIHTVNDDPDHPQGGQPKRFTLWEVHPITAVFECAVPSNDCDPHQEADWIQVH